MDEAEPLQALRALLAGHFDEQEFDTRTRTAGAAYSLAAVHAQLFEATAQLAAAVLAGAPSRLPLGRALDKLKASLTAAEHADLHATLDDARQRRNRLAHSDALQLVPAFLLTGDTGLLDLLTGTAAAFQPANRSLLEVVLAPVLAAADMTRVEFDRGLAGIVWRMVTDPAGLPMTAAVDAALGDPSAFLDALRRMLPDHEGGQDAQTEKGQQT